MVLRGRQVEGLTDANERFQTQIPNYPALFEILERNQVRTRVEPTDQGNIFLAILNSWLPMLLIIGIWLFFMRQIQGGGNKAMSFGKIRTQKKFGTPGRRDARPVLLSARGREIPKS